MFVMDVVEMSRPRRFIYEEYSSPLSQWTMKRKEVSNFIEVLCPLFRHPTCSYMPKLPVLFWSKLLRKCYFYCPTKFRNTSENLLCNSFILLNLLSLFWKIKVGLCDLHVVCVSVYPLLSISEWLNQPFSCRVYHAIWIHINGVLHKSRPSIYVSVCVSPYRC
jgi:hypothetical protein